MVEPANVGCVRAAELRSEGPAPRDVCSPRPHGGNTWRVSFVHVDRIAVPIVCILKLDGSKRNRERSIDHHTALDKAGCTLAAGHGHYVATAARDRDGRVQRISLVRFDAT